MGIGVSDRRAGSCHCSLPDINRYLGGQWKLVFSICGEISKDAWCHSLKSHLHDWIMHVLKKSPTPVQADGEPWRELTGKVSSIIQIGSLIPNYL